MRKIFKLLVITLFTFSASKVLATPANTSFTDDEFYNCIVVKLNTDGFNSVYDRDASTYNVTKEELDSITVLKCNDANISNTKGLELLTKLVDLNLSDNNIAAIDLTSNTKITNLLLSNNKLSTIDLTKNTALENLYLNGNKLTTLNLNNNKELLVLNINNNSLTNLDLTNNTKIMDLKATNSAFVAQNKTIFKGESLTLDLNIKFPEGNDVVKNWQNPTWATKDANIATVNQKGTVKANKSGNVNVTASVSDIYTITYNIKTSEIFSDIYNIDDANATIAVSDASIQTILNNIRVDNGEIMIYNTNNKYVTSGNIASGFKLKILEGAQVLKVYTLTLVQEIVNNDLESLEISNYSIDFAKDKTNYTIIVENSVENIEVTAKAIEESASVNIEGNTGLVSGTNTVTITVTGKDNTTKVYTINVIKKASDNEKPDTPSQTAYLEKLEIEGYKINFDKNVDYYNIKIKSDVESLNITALATDENAVVKINGNNNLKNKSKIEVVVIATDGTQKVYTINIQKPTNIDWKLILTILELIALFLMILLCIILISKHNKKGKKNKKDLKEISKKETMDIVSEEKTIGISKKELNSYNKTETHLEKTIRFRRACPNCGSINVLTNDVCYLCGKKLDEEPKD